MYVCVLGSTFNDGEDGNFQDTESKKQLVVMWSTVSAAGLLALLAACYAATEVGLSIDEHVTQSDKWN